MRRTDPGLENLIGKNIVLTKSTILIKSITRDTMTIILTMIDQGLESITTRDTTTTRTTLLTRSITTRHTIERTERRATAPDLSR